MFSITCVHDQQKIHKSNHIKYWLKVQELNLSESTFTHTTKPVLLTNIKKLYLDGLFLACGATPPAALAPFSLLFPLELA
jgi:hypothetical protein